MTNGTKPIRSIEALDKAVYDAARSICAEQAILGGWHAFDDSVTFATAHGVRQRLLHGRSVTDVPSGHVVGATLKRLAGHGLLRRVQLERRYRTARAKPVRVAGYVIVGEQP